MTLRGSARGSNLEALPQQGHIFPNVSRKCPQLFKKRPNPSKCPPKPSPNPSKMDPRGPPKTHFPAFLDFLIFLIFQIFMIFLIFLIFDLYNKARLQVCLKRCMKAYLYVVAMGRQRELFAHAFGLNISQLTEF